MAESSKRRRLSPTTYVAVVDQTVQAPRTPTTSKRASYQSPTKAFLARSNPTALQLLDRAKERRESEPNRRQSLRDASLNNTRPSTAQQVPSQKANASQAMNNEGRNDIHDVGGSFTPVRVARTSRNTSEQPDPEIPTPRRQYVPPPALHPIIPKLVKTSSAPSSTERARKSTSPELPPTPVQLGKDSAPERPRGLFSSSPSRTGRKQFTIRNMQATSSPLKLRNPPPIFVEATEGPDEAASGIGSDESEHEMENTETQREDRTQMLGSDLYLESSAGLDLDLPLPETIIDSKIRDKHQTYKDLRNQCQILQEEAKQLEHLSRKLNYPTLEQIPIKTDEAIAMLVGSSESIPRTLIPRLEDHEVFKAHSGKYLAAFAAHGLRMVYENWGMHVNGSHKRIYQITFKAPDCWPAETLNLTFSLTVDLESSLVESIVYLRATGTPAPLVKWIDERLEDPISKLDLSLIVTGIANYFHESVTRAKVMKRLSNDHNQRGSIATELRVEEVVDAVDLALALCLYLSEKSHVYQLDNQSNSKTRQSLGNAKQLMLAYDIGLDWVGEATLTVDVCTSGFSDTVVSNARKLFKEKADLDGVYSAFQTVKSVLATSHKLTDANSWLGHGSKHKARKARRMTEAEFDR